MWRITPGHNPVFVKDLTGHTRAVTSVDWQRLKDGKEYFVSCSDDMLIRIYDPKDEEFALIAELNTKFITDWHTLTYLALEKVR